MGRFLDLSYKSLFHHGEELCGDQVIISRLEDSKIMILTDGMGHGVRANILATLTGKILLTLFSIYQHFLMKCRTFQIPNGSSMPRIALLA